MSVKERTILRFIIEYIHLENGDFQPDPDRPQKQFSFPSKHQIFNQEIYVNDIVTPRRRLTKVGRNL